MEEAEEPKKAKVEGETPVQVKAFWRELSVKNIKSLARVAEKTHPDLPERDEVFAERANLFPGGCLSLMEGKSNELGGYVISHPIKYLQTPALDSLLGEIASDANQYYIHVLAILPESKDMALRGKHFWSRFGFVPVRIDDVLKKKLLEYGEDATYLERRNEEY